MAKKTNLKAEKAKRNKAYALLHKRKKGRPMRPRPAMGSLEGRPEGTSGPRPGFAAVCSACGTSTTLPFEPVSGKPVYCQDCFQASGKGRPSSGPVSAPAPVSAPRTESSAP